MREEGGGRKRTLIIQEICNYKTSTYVFVIETRMRRREEEVWESILVVPRSKTRPNHASIRDRGASAISSSFIIVTTVLIQ